MVVQIVNARCAKRVEKEIIIKEELLFEVLNNNSGGDNTIDRGSLCRVGVGRSALCSNFLLGQELCIGRDEQITIGESSSVWCMLSLN